MISLSDCLELARGKTPQDFVQMHPHAVIIGLGVLPGELQRNPAKASGTLFLNLSPDQAPAGGDGADNLVNQVFEIRKSVSQGDVKRVEVGWSPQNDIDVPDHTISRSHAHFVTEGGTVHVVDGGSTNGTYLNGTRLEAGKPTEVRSGDILTFGRYSFTFYDSMAFAKLLSVQAMMRPRASRRPGPTGGARGAAQLAGASNPRRATESLTATGGDNLAARPAAPVAAPASSSPFDQPTVNLSRGAVKAMIAEAAANGATAPAAQPAAPSQAAHPPTAAAGNPPAPPAARGPSPFAEAPTAPAWTPPPAPPGSAIAPATAPTSPPFWERVLSALGLVRLVAWIRARRGA